MSALRRSLTLTGTLAITAVALTALAPTASAHIVIPIDDGPALTPTTPPPTTVTAGLPLWAVLAIVAGAILIAAATTLITLSVTRRHHRAVATQAETPPTEARDDDVSPTNADLSRSVGQRW